MIGLLMKATGLGRGVSSLIVYGGAVILLGLALLWLRADAYRDGEKAADARWVEAGQKLERAAAESGRAADVRAAERLEEHHETVAEEKEKLDEAAREGTDPFDVLFGPTGVSD